MKCSFFLFFILPLFILTEVSAASPEGSRVSFNSGWLFARFGSMPDGAVKQEPGALEMPDANDSTWRKLNVPHDWGIEGPFSMNLPGSTGRLPWMGIGWYRKHFRISPADSSKRMFLDFDGAMSHAKVWLNGQYLGEWPYGYASFRLELSRHLRYDGENVLAVRLENPPDFSRWYPGGGIYRNVWLIRKAPVHIAHWGTFITTPTIKKDFAVVHVNAEVENQSGSTASLRVRVQLRDCQSSGLVASSKDLSLAIPAGQTRKCEFDLRVKSPRRWSPQSPALYCATTTLLQKGAPLDADQTVFGIRTVEFTPDRGLLINGRRVPINGVCNHHDLGLLGTAVNSAALERQILLLKEMGCNAIRTSHNPPAPELLDLCDRKGMLVLDEAFDCWEKGKVENDYSTLFKEWHERDIRALVRRDRNHPSVIAWSSGNEIGEQGNGELVERLRAIFLSEDSTRPVTAACDNPKAGFNGFQNAVDIFGYNYKPHLYGKFREANPSKPLFGSETASCVSSFSEYFFPVSNDKAKGAIANQVSSYDLYAPPWATSPDVEFEGQDRNPSVAGEFVWTGFDYLGEPTPFGGEGSPARSSYFGILDLCGLKKDRFYLYQSRWRPDLPMAHLLPHWNWPERVGMITPVHVYTSGDEAELFLNGQSLGRKSKKPFEYRLRWDDVTYAPGELKVVAYKGGKTWATDVVRTAGLPARLEVSLDRTRINADGSDLAFVTVRVVDEKGTRVPSASGEIRFHTSGPGVIAAVGNGDPTDHDTFQTDRCKAFHGQCLAIVRSVKGASGTIRLTVESDGLEGGECQIGTNRIPDSPSK